MEKVVAIEGKTNKNLLITLLYIVLLLFFAFKMYFYNAYVARFPDEISHISYVAYLQSTKKIIPEFKEITILRFTDKNATIAHNAGITEKMVFSDTVNQLGHPPLYYHILRLSGGITVDGKSGDIYVNIYRLRYFSMMIALAAMLLLFYIGRTRVGPNAAFHFLYAVICVSIPMLAYESAGVNNDTMSFLCFTIFAFGILRFFEKRRNAGTYLLIAFGLSGCLLSKLTAGIIAFTTAFNILIYLLIKEKNIRFLLSGRFLVTVPVYLVMISYFAAVKYQTGSFQPTLAILNPDQFYISDFFTPQYKGSMTFAEYTCYYFQEFISTWTGIVSHVSLRRYGSVFGINNIGLFSLLFLPVVSYIGRSHEKLRDSAVVFAKCAFPAVAATMLLQFYHTCSEFMTFSGYKGGYQSRYYLCAVSFFAFSAVAAAKTLYGAYGKGKNTVVSVGENGTVPINNKSKARHIAVNIGCVAFSFLLIYEDFVYFVLNFNKYIK